MNKLLCVLCVLACFTAAVPCSADTVNGVLAEERVVSLPQDQAKWYVSVVGDANNARYNEILGWFDSNPSLTKLKNQVHFCPVATGTAIYKDRYSGNVTGLPAVRLQTPDGKVIYEAAGKSIPLTAAGLNGALANAVNEAEGLRPALPWRREMERRCQPKPQPEPQPQPQPDPEPQPLDNGGKPDVEPEPMLPPWLLAPLCAATLLIGLGLGYGKKLGEKLMPAGKK